MHFLLADTSNSSGVACISMFMRFNNRQDTGQYIIRIITAVTMDMDNVICLSADQFSIFILALTGVLVNAERTVKFLISSFQRDGRQNQRINCANSHNTAKRTDDTVPNASVVRFGLPIY